MKGLSIPAAWHPHLPRIGLGLAVVMLFILHSFHVINLPLIESFEGVLYDARLRATMPGTVYTQVVIIDIDEKSLKAEGRWPWGRERMGELVKQLSDHYKVAVIGMDVVFAEPENMATLNMMARLSQQDATQNKETKAMFSKLKAMLDGDQAFARSLKDRSVVLGYYFKYESNIEADNTSGKLPAPACDLAQAASKGMKLPQAAGYGANLPVLQEAAAGGGHFIPNVDADGSIRSIPLLMAYQGGCYEALSLAVFRKALEATTVTIEKGKDLEPTEFKCGRLANSGKCTGVSLDSLSWLSAQLSLYFCGRYSARARRSPATGRGDCAVGHNRSRSAGCPCDTGG